MYKLRKRQIIIISIFVALALRFISATFVNPASAQRGESAWSDPVNISQTGGTSEPQIVVDSDGGIHVYWSDSFDGLIYSYRDQAGNWADPTQVQVPFEDSLNTLKLFSDSKGFIHAYWVDDSNSLLYSRTSSTGSSPGWGNSLFLAGGVVDFYAVLKGSLNHHLGYITSEEFPTGIYYRSLDETGIWTNPILIYQSSYFRNLTAGDAHVWIDEGGDDLVYLSWDDPYEERIYAVWSDNGGNTWSEPGLIDQREEEDSPDSSGPSKSMIHFNRDDAIILWQAGHEGETCTQYFAVIPNEPSDTTFVEGDFPNLNIKRKPLSESTRGCPEELQFMEQEDNILWLLTKANGTLQLSTWSGSEWSPLQSQNELLELIHPNTFRRLTLDCHQAKIYQDQLQIVGCDAGKTNDIWFTERSLGNTASWFPTPTPAPLWSTPVVVTQGDEVISFPILVSSPNRRMQAIWSGERGGILYAYFDGDRWTQPVEAVTSPGEQVGELSAAIDRNANLFVTWDVPGSEAIYYSWVNEAEATISSKWIAPQTLPIPNTVRSPQVKMNSEGVIDITYVVPLNEERGVYLIRAIEPIQAGQPLQWESPELVFDAEAAGWSMVDDVRFDLGEDETRNILWTRFDTPPDGKALGLYYTRLIDGTWSEPKEIYKDLIDWSQLLVSSDGSIHNAWQVTDDSGRTTFWHLYSTNQGASWSDPIRISGFSSGEGPASLLLDDSGRIQLVQVSQSGFISLDGQPTLVLQNWVFNGVKWSPDERLTLDNLINPETLSASTTFDGSLAALLLAEIIPENEEDEPNTGLFYSQRPVDILETMPTPLPTFTPNPTLLDNNSTPEPSPTPTLVFSLDSSTRLPSILNNRWAGILVGGIPAVLVVGLALMAILRRTRK